MFRCALLTPRQLDMLKTDTRALTATESDSSEDETSPAKTPTPNELEQESLQRHAFLFGRYSSASLDTRELHPLPSQVPFLLDVFSECVNVFIQIVHVPTIYKMIRSLGGNDMTRLTPPNEALMFSIYYAAIASMEEDDVRNHSKVGSKANPPQVMANFGASKADISLKYRLGLEHCLAKADFLNNPDLVLVQALSLFLMLVRRHDSPRFVWMMTGLVIKSAQYLGLQRDGTHFENLTPFEIEMRRRVWWVVFCLDIRSAEDQGTEPTIAAGSFDTRYPLNINDSEISPETAETPAEHDGVTDMSFALGSLNISNLSKQIVEIGVRDGADGLPEQNRLLNQIYDQIEREYFSDVKESDKIIYWVGFTMGRMVRAKMTLIALLPILFSSKAEFCSGKIRNRLLIAAIEVAEHNHALNAEQPSKPWRWLYQTCTHWHAVVFLVLEIARRPWSPTIERAFVALHSEWLIPSSTSTDKDLRIWVPLRKLMTKARKHREAELKRLRADRNQSARLEVEDQNMPVPASPGPHSAESIVEIFRKRWHQLLIDELEDSPSTLPSWEFSSSSLGGNAASSTTTSAPFLGSYHASAMTTSSTTTGASVPQADGSHQLANANARTLSSCFYGHSEPWTAESLQRHLPAMPDESAAGYGSIPWLWADADPSTDVFSNMDPDTIDANMDLDEEVSWHNWIGTAMLMERDARSHR